MIDEDKNVSIKIMTIWRDDWLIDVDRIFVIKIKVINVFDKFDNWKRIVICRNSWNENDDVRNDDKNNDYNHDIDSKNWIDVNRWWNNNHIVTKNIFDQIDFRKRWRLISIIDLILIVDLRTLNDKNKFFEIIWLYSSVTKNI